VIVEWAGRYLGTAIELYKAPKPLVIPPNTVVVEEAKFRYPALYVSAPVYGKDYIALTGSLGSVPFGTSGINTSTQIFAQHANITLHNYLSYDTVYICNLVMRGVPLIGEEAQERRWDTGLSILPGKKDYRIPANPYVQSAEQVSRLGGYLRDRLQRPRRLLQWSGMACPWLELLDRVTLSHNTMVPNPGVNMDCYVVGNQMQYRAGGAWEQSLTLLPAADLYAYASYFTVGVSSYADTGSERLAY